MSSPGGFLAPREGSVPGDRCVRCGKPTPAGVALCDVDNPGGVSGPSATQMHATILGGVLLGFLGFLLLARLAVTTGGPFATELIGSAADSTGTLHVGVAGVNEGETEGVADCRVTRDGVPRPDDAIFRTARLAPGERVAVERVVPPPRQAPTYDADTLTVVCQ
jgi:hypothetical protein